MPIMEGRGQTPLTRTPHSEPTMTNYTDRQYAKYTNCPKSQWWTNVRLAVLTGLSLAALAVAILINLYS